MAKRFEHASTAGQIGDNLARKVTDALQHQVELDSVTAFFPIDGDHERANIELRDSLREILSDGDELWYFSTTIDAFNRLAGMAGYAVLTDGVVRDFVLVVQN